MSVLETLKPSQLTELAASVGDKENRKAFLLDLARKLFSARLDGGGADDEIFVMTRKLTAAGVWNNVPAYEISFAIAGLNRVVRELFLDGLEPEYRHAVEEVLVVGPTEAPSAEELDEIIERSVQSVDPYPLVRPIYPSRDEALRQKRGLVVHVYTDATSTIYGARTVVVGNAKYRKMQGEMLREIIESSNAPPRPSHPAKRSSRTHSSD